MVLCSKLAQRKEPKGWVNAKRSSDSKRRAKMFAERKGVECLAVRAAIVQGGCK